jgi:hypothetical protein
MAIKPIGQRLDQMIEQEELTESNDMPEPIQFEAKDPIAEDEEPVQVAGLFNIGAGAAKKAIKKVTTITETPAKIPDAPMVKGENPILTPDVPIEPKLVPETSVPEPKVEMTPQQFIEAKQVAAGVGKPPEQPFNYDLVNTEDGLNQAFEALAKSVSPGYEKLTQKEVIEEIKKLGVGKEYIDQMESTFNQYKNLPIEVPRAVLAAVAQTKKIDDLAKRFIAGESSPELEAQFLQESALATVAFQRAKGIQALPGQALAMLNQNRPVISAENVADLAKNPEISGRIKQAATAITELTDEAAKGELIEKMTKVQFVKDLWLSTWINGLLSGPATFVVNVTSSTAFAAMQPLVRLAASGMRMNPFDDPLTSQSFRELTNVNVSPDKVYAGEALAGVASFPEAAREALSMAWQTLRYGTTREQRLTGVSDVAEKVEQRGAAFGLDASQYGFEGKTAAALSLWSRITAAPGRILATQDEAFKAGAYVFERNAIAYRFGKSLEDELLSQGIDPTEAARRAAERIVEIKKNPPPEVDAAAVDFGKMLTFSRDLDGFAASVQKFSNTNVLTKTTLPFVRTPTWLISEGLQYSYFAPLSKQWRKDMAEGGATADLAMAKFGLGSMFMAGATSLAVEGRITGGGPSDPNLRKAYMRDGWRPYSITMEEGEYDQEFIAYLKKFKFLDPSLGKNKKLYISLRGLDPIARPLAMAADYAEYARYEDDEDAVSQVAIGALFGLYNSIAEAPFMQAASSMVGILGNHIPNKQQALKDLINKLSENVAGFTIGGSPVGAWSSMQATIERALDSGVSDFKAPPDMDVGTKGYYEGLMRHLSRTPGLSSMVKPKLNRWAEVEQSLDPQNPVLGLLGIRTSKSDWQPVDRVIASLGLPLGEPDRTVSQGGATVKLDTEQFNKMLNIYAKELKIDGKNVQQMIVFVAKQDWFQSYQFEEKQKIIRLVDEKFMKIARETLIQRNPSLQIKLKEEQRKKGVAPTFGLAPKNEVTGFEEIDALLNNR